MSVTPVPTKAFTDEMLAQNFIAISKAFFEFENWSEKVDKQLIEVFKLASKKPSKLKPFVLGAVVGAALYREVKRRNVRVETIVGPEAAKVFDETAENVKQSAEKVAKQTAAQLKTIKEPKAGA